MSILVLKGSSGGGGGGGSTALSTAVNTLSSPNTWTSFTVTNTYNTNPGGGGIGGQDTSWTYSPRLIWDSLNSRIVHYGGQHAGSTGQWHVVGRYVESTNAWLAGEVVPVTSDFSHGYNKGTMDNAGNLFFFTYDSSVLRKRTSAGVYSDLATYTDRYNITQGLSYHPGMDGGNGGLAYGDALSVAWYEIDADTWHSIQQVGSIFMGEYSQASTYVPAHGAVYVGGGESNSTIHRINANATHSTISDVPNSRYPYIGSYANSPLRMLMATQTSGLVLVNFSENEYYEYDGSTWSSNLGTLNASLLSAAGSDRILAGGMVPAHGSQLYDAFVFFYLTSQGARDPATTCYVWRYN